MIYCGMVLKVKSKYVCVMTDDYGFLKIKKNYIEAKSDLRSPVANNEVKVGQYIYFNEEDILKDGFKKITFIKHLSIAAVFVLIFLGFIFINGNGNKMLNSFPRKPSDDNPKKSLNNSHQENNIIASPSAKVASDESSTNKVLNGNNTEKSRDLIKKTFTISNDPTVIEVENVIFKGAIIKNIISEFDGTGYLEGFKGKDSYIEMNLDVKRAAEYDFWLKFNNINKKDDKDMDIYLNGSKQDDPINFIDYDPNSQWDQIDYEIKFKKGHNVLKLVSCDNEFSLRIDNIKILYAKG